MFNESSSVPARRTATFAAAVCLLVILAAELFLSAGLESQTSDEAYHLEAGYRYWHSRDFGINPQHPPFLKLLASSPLLFFSHTCPQ